MDLREVYRAQLNLDMRTQDPNDWEHYAMIFHPTQPLLLLTIRSEFDGNKTGEAFRKILAERLEAEGLVKMNHILQVADRISGQEHLIRINASKYDIAHVVTSCLGRGFAVWGEIVQKGDILEVQIRSLDVRPGGTSTKDWPEARKWETSRKRFAGTARDVVAAVLENARVVTRLRVKLYAYWPAGNYYFDNITLTQEPASLE